MPNSTYNEQLIQTLTARLQQLQLTAAAKGIDTPPDVLMEIEELSGKIELVKVSSRDTITVQMLERMEPAERWKRLYDATWELEVYMHTMQKNRESDRKQLADRHKEFNLIQQRHGYELDNLRRSISRLHVIIVSIVLLFPVVLWITLFVIR